MIDGLKSFDLWEQGLGIPPTLPGFYWNVYSYEQRIKEICLRLERMLEYQDVQTDKINECVDQVNLLTGKVEALTKEVARINQALLDEIEARKAGDQKLETELQQEINDRIKAINDEATTRQAQVDKLTADLEDEATTRQAQVDKLTTDLEDEATTRQAQVDKLTTDLEDEATTRQAQVDKLTTDLTTETTARTEADKTLQTNIDKVAGDLTTETNARTEAISELDTRVTQNTTQIADEVTARTNLGNSLTEAITNEQTARETKDKELDQQIADLTVDQPSIESENIYTASDKLPTVTAIQNSINQAVTADNKIATMADLSGGGGGTDINSITPLNVVNASSAGTAALAWGDAAEADGEGSIAIGARTQARGRNSVAIGRGSYVDVTEDDTFSVGDSSVGTSRRITNVSWPTNDNDAATKGYVDNKELTTGDPETITRTSDNTDINLADKTGLYEATFVGNVPAGTVGDAYGFNILQGDTIIGTVAGFRGTIDQTGVPLIGNVLLEGNKSYKIGQTGITQIVLRKIA